MLCSKCVCVYIYLSKCSIWLLCRDNNPYTMGSDIIKTSFTASVILQYFLLHSIYKHSHIMSNTTEIFFCVFWKNGFLMLTVTGVPINLNFPQGLGLPNHRPFQESDLSWWQWLAILLRLLYVVLQYKWSYYFLTAYYRLRRWLKIFPSEVWSQALLHIS